MWPIPVATRFKMRVWGFSPAGIAGSNPGGGMMSDSFDGFVLSCRGLCDGLITRPEESYICLVSWNVIVEPR